MPGVVYALSALGTVSFIANRQHLRNRRPSTSILTPVVELGFSVFGFAGGLDGFCLEPSCEAEIYLQARGSINTRMNDNPI